MPWLSGSLSVYHGTDDLSAQSIFRSGIDPRRFRAHTDFGSGFYVTTVLHQARQWANQRCRRTGRRPVVLQYDLSLPSIEKLTHLCFVVDSADYYRLVTYCRGGGSNHGHSRSQPYDVVYGPVALRNQELVIANCDQILFSNPSTLPDFDKPTDRMFPGPRQKLF